MSSVSKEDYITRSLSNLDFKRWELYVVTRIFHRLNDPEIEFVFQQPIRNSSTRNPYLVDLFFPQLGLYLEICGHIFSFELDLLYLAWFIEPCVQK